MFCGTTSLPPGLPDGSSPKERRPGEDPSAYQNGGWPWRSPTSIFRRSRAAKNAARRRRRNNKAANRRRGGTADLDERGGKVHDYRAKHGVLKTLILLPPGAPWEYLDRETLWNAAEDAERRYNAVVAREMDLALPHELSLEEQFTCARAFGEYLMDRYHVAVDIAHHQPFGKDGHDRRNYHAHIMFTSREVAAAGFGKKTRILTIEQYKAELSFKAETVRASVPPEYRPRIEVPGVIWDDGEHPEEGSLGDHFQGISRPADNGGFAQAPPPITQPFNVAAGLEPKQPYKQKVQIGFGIA